MQMVGFFYFEILVHMRVHSFERTFRDVRHIDYWEHLWRMFSSRNKRLGARVWNQKIIIFLIYCFLLFSKSGYILVWLWGSLILICFCNQINLCRIFYSPFSFLLSANTSCGLPLKMLRKTPIYTCGTYLVMLVPPPGGSGSSATRSLFGGTSGLSSLKSKQILFVALFPARLPLWNRRLFLLMIS